MIPILFVDDSNFSRKQALSLLPPNVYEVHQAQSGAEALQILQRVPVKVVLTDLLMPEMDGFELLKTIKRIYPRIQVIILSADIQISSRKLCEELGAAGFLNKPVSAENLATILKQVLTESSCS